MSDGSRRARYRGWLIGVVAAVLAPGCAETPRAGLGELCSEHIDCVNSAQCFAGLCAPRCAAHTDCGGGYTCTPGGLCERVASQIGDVCDRELDCGPSQACQLDAVDHDGDGVLGSSCQQDRSGTVTGARCAADDDCRSGLCAIGMCSEVCAIDGDCPGDMACVEIPRLLASGAPMFRGCLPATGRLDLELPLSAPGQTIRVPVPSHAVSFAMIADIDNPRHWVGATRVEAPDGALLYRTPLTEDEYYANALRYAPARQISTLLLPSSPELPLEVGAYSIAVASFHFNGGPSAEVPRVRVVYKLGAPQSSSILDVNLYFLDLEDHPCDSAFPDGLDAFVAATSSELQSYLLALHDTLAEAGVSLGTITYHDIEGRADLDSIHSGTVGALLSESTTDDGVNVFFVRSIHPVGVQALVGGSPGTPGVGGTPASGVAVSVETLCYRGWDELARTTAHAAARQLGLFRNVEPDGHGDPIADSATDSSNLMYFSEFGGRQLSAGQGQVLRNNPGLR